MARVRLPASPSPSPSARADRSPKNTAAPWSAHGVQQTLLSTSRASAGVALASQSHLATPKHGIFQPARNARNQSTGSSEVTANAPQGTKR